MIRRAPAPVREMSRETLAGDAFTRLSRRSAMSHPAESNRTQEQENTHAHMHCGHAAPPHELTRSHCAAAETLLPLLLPLLPHRATPQPKAGPSQHTCTLPQHRPRPRALLMPPLVSPIPPSPSQQPRAPRPCPRHTSSFPRIQLRVQDGHLSIATCLSLSHPPSRPAATQFDPDSILFYRASSPTRGSSRPRTRPLTTAALVLLSLVSYESLSSLALVCLRALG